MTQMELYPSELNQVRDIATKLQKKYGFSSFNDRTREIYEREVVEEFATIGLEARVTWSMDVDSKTDNLYHIPTVEILGRIDNEFNMDHERMKHEVTSGELDGKAGFIREDGTFREDPIKKSY